MFNNVGAKIKLVAEIICWLGIILCPLMGILQVINGDSVGWVVLISGPGIAWLSSLVIYALGEITENSDIRTRLALEARQEREAASAFPAPEAPAAAKDANSASPQPEAPA